MKDKDIERWDLLASDYSEWLATDADPAVRAFSGSIREAIVRELPKDRETLVLEIGCGDGTLMEELTRHYDEVIGIDGSRQMIQLARTRCPESAATTLVGDATRSLPFANASFDVIVSNMTLMCIEHVSDALQEIQRILQPNGVFLFTIPHPCFSFTRRYLASGQHRYVEHFAVDIHLGPTFGSTVRNYHRPLQFYTNELRHHGLMLRSIAEISAGRLPEALANERLRPYYLTSNAMLFNAGKL